MGKGGGHPVEAMIGNGGEGPDFKQRGCFLQGFKVLNDIKTTYYSNAIAMLWLRSFKWFIGTL